MLQIFVQRSTKRTTVYCLRLLIVKDAIWICVFRCLSLIEAPPDCSECALELALCRSNCFFSCQAFEYALCDEMGLPENLTPTKFR